MEEEKKLEPREQKHKTEQKEEGKQKIEKSLKGKMWIQILAPKFFEEKKLGETLVSEPEQVLGRTIEANTFEFGGSPEKFYYKLFFKISEVTGSMARTKFFGHDCSRDFLARVVHYNSTRLDTNQIVQLKDGRLRIKSVAITARPVSQKVAKNLRKKISEKVSELSALTLEEFVKSAMSDEIQQSMKAEINKIYPLRVLEFRKSEVIEGK